MTLVANFDAAYLAPLRAESFAERQIGSESGSEGFGLLSRKLNEIRFGSTRYHLRNWIQARFTIDPISGGYRYLASGLPSVAGAGRTPQEAIERFNESFHVRFQELLAMRPFEMGEDERQTWYEIDGIFDAEGYRNEIPVRVRQFGEVVDSRSGHRAVRWEGTSRKESVDLMLYPDEFAAYKPGQPFEAIVQREPHSGRAIQVLHVSKRSLPKKRSKVESDEILDGLRSTDDLPVSPWE